jgi:DNA repair protein RecO (recombination protein O)
MDQRTTGLILRTRPLTETSLIVEWLSPDCGRLATVAKGARRAKSAFRGQLDLFFLCEFTFVRSRRSELHTLREVSLVDAHPLLRTNLGWLEQAAYATALIEQTTERETPLAGCFELLLGFVRQLPVQPPGAESVFAFEMKLLSELGLRPDLAQASLSPGASQALNTLATLEWPALARLRLTPAQRTEIRRFLHGFLIYHLGRLPAGRSRALGVSTEPADGAPPAGPPG